MPLISTSFLAVVFLATGVSSVVQWKRVEAEREMALRMQYEAMAQRDRSEQLRREAAEAIDALKAPKEVDKAKKKEQ